MGRTYLGWRPDVPISRRSAVRAGALAAGAVALAGCAQGVVSGSGSAQPAAPKAKETLVWRPWYNFTNATSKAGLALMQQGIQPFLDQNPGLEVQITTMGYQMTTVAAMLAGTGPDVLEDWVLPMYTENDLVLNLNPYITRDNVDLTIYPSGQMAFFKEAGSLAQSGAGLYCLPAYLHTAVQRVNLSALDELGLAYPQPDWTHLDWTKLWESVTTKASAAGGKARGGASLYWSGYDSYGGNPADCYWWGFGGEFVDPSNPDKSYLSSPGSIAFGEWCFPLLQAGVIRNGGSIESGQVVCEPAGTAGDMITAARSSASIKWDFFPQPVFPVRRTSYSASDFYAISAAAKNPALCWEFLKYLCVDKEWQRFMVKLSLAGPNQKPLWQEYTQTVQQVAPPLANKNIQVLAQSVLNDEPYRGLVFHYADAQCATIINSLTALAQSGKMTVRDAFTQATQQLDALQTAGKTLVATSAAKAKAFPTLGPQIAAVPTGL